jgi:type II secretory pathway pseudopilin PulG
MRRRMADKEGVQRRPAGAIRAATRDAGFGLIEQIIAMTVVVGALLGLLTTLGATAQGVSTARQRTIAVSLAKQAIERLQGDSYQNVAMSLSSLTGEPLVAGVAPNQTFEGESIVPGGPNSYRTYPVSAGTTFSLRTFVTAVPAGGSAYRRVTVIVDWPTVAPRHTIRFSSLVYPLNYASYPASSGAAEVTGGQMTISGHLGGDTFEDARVVLPGMRADTSASTLRTSIAAAAGATPYVDLLTGPIALACSGVGTDIGECPRQTVESVADNDSTSTTGNWVARVAQAFVGGSVTTSGGATINTPPGTMTARASTDACATCGFGDNDGVPWADATAATNAAAAAAFASNHGVGALTGNLWSLDGAWTAAGAVDHDPTGNGIVTASAQLSAPALRVLMIAGAPSGFDGAVKVGAFTAGTSVVSGYTLVAPDVTTGTTTRQVQLWETTGAYPLGHYRAITVAAGSATDQVASATFTSGDHVVSFNSRVQSQASTYSTGGTAPRRDATAQHPSILVVTVEVTITSLTLVEAPPTTPTTTTIPATTTTVSATTTTSTVATSTTSTTPASTTTTTPVTTTTVPPTPLVTDSFTIVVDYGRVSVHDTWLPKP